MKEIIGLFNTIKRYAWQEVCRNNGNSFDARNRCVAVPDENIIPPEERAQLIDLSAKLRPEVESKVRSAQEQGVSAGTDLYFGSRFVSGFLVFRWEGER